MEKLLCIIYLICAPVFIVWAIREQLRRNKQWRLWELKGYLDNCYKIPCSYCKGTGYEGYTLDGEPTGEFCESCESYGFVWCAIYPPRWLKHGNIWRQSEFEQQLQVMLFRKQGGKK